MEKQCKPEGYNIGSLRAVLGGSGLKKARNHEKTFLAEIPDFPSEIVEMVRNEPILGKNPDQQTGQKPPDSGKCKVCKRSIKVNSKRICYECFIKANLLKSGWTRFDIHPNWCKCSLTVPHIGNKSNGN